MSLDDNQPLIHFEDEVVTSEQLLERAKARLARHNFPEPRWPGYGQTSLLKLSPNSLDLLNLHHALRLANEAQDKFDVEPVIAASPASRLPVIGRFWQIIRQQAHSLALFYVNRSVGQQSQVNHNLMQAVNELARLVIEQREEIDALRCQLNEQKEQE
jgi:hypothetical protein